MTTRTLPDQENCFTIGELADFYSVPKQTLIYYCRTGLLVPEYTDETNGYRYYSVKQFLTLEIIFNLRKLNVPVKIIKNFLEEKSPEALSQILQEKEQECCRLIERAQQTKQSLQLCLQALGQLKQIPINIIEVSFQEALPIQLSPKLTKEMSPREHVKMFTEHNQSVFSRTAFRDFATGWIISRQDFLQKKFNQTQQFFTPLAEPDTAACCSLRPAGLYLRIHFLGTYYEHIQSIHQKIMDYLSRNQMEIIGDIYDLPLKNHWQTNDTRTYINQLSLQVRYRSEKNDS